MGYTTYFNGTFAIDRKVDDETAEYIRNFNRTRRMKRDPGKLAKRLGLTKKEVIAKYGEECELWCGDTEALGQTSTDDVVDFNSSGKQPGLWCKWTITDDNQYIEWDGNEKFYDYVEWIEFINERILKPRGYKLTHGDVYWTGEDGDDLGMITIEDGKVVAKPAVIVYAKYEDHPRVQSIINNYLTNEFKEVIDHKLDGN